MEIGALNPKQGGLGVNTIRTVKCYCTLQLFFMLFYGFFFFCNISLLLIQKKGYCSPFACLVG